MSDLWQFKAERIAHDEEVVLEVKKNMISVRIAFTADIERISNGSEY
jgi:hypothetical protein